MPANAPPKRARARIRRAVLRVLRVIALAYLGVLLVLSVMQSKLIFPGQVSQGTPDARVDPPPGAELVTLSDLDGTRVVALFGPALTPDGRPRPEAAQRPSILFFYGNGECVAACGLEFERFRRLGANVLIPDYLGYGLSGGDAGESGCYRAADAALAHLRQRPDVEPSRIIAVGWSIGGAVAIDLAARTPLAGLAVFCSFTSMGEMVRRVMNLPGLVLMLKHRFRSLEKIPKVRCPILLGHGSRDHLIPAAMSDRLAEAAGGPVTSFRVDSDHNNFFPVGSEQIDLELGRLIDRVARGDD